MATNLRIETLDRSGRWYLTPGSRSIYDLRVRNEAKEIADCSIVIEDPDSGVTVDPPTLKLQGNEVRTVTVLFSESAHPTRSQRVLMKLRDTSGADVAIFEHPLLLAGLTDCSITLSFKDVIVENTELKGFLLSCGLRSQSEGPANFQISWAAHPALSVSEIPSISLEPGEAGEVAIPVRWNRTVKDGAGLNHPHVLEVGIAVSNGKRSARLRWESIEPKLDPSAWKNAYAEAKASAPSPVLLLTDQLAVKCLPNPAIASPAIVTTNGAVRKEEVVELPLFPDLNSPVLKTAQDGPTIEQPLPPPQTAQEPTPQAQTPTQSAPAQPQTSAQPFAPNPATASAPAPTTPTQAQTPASKLTPYNPVRWDAMADSVVSSKVTTTVIRTRPAAEAPKRIPVGVIAGGASAIGAIALAVMLFRPNSSVTTKVPATTSVAVATTAAANVAKQVTMQPLHHLAVRPTRAKPKAGLASPAARVTTTSQPTSAPTQAPQTPRPATPRPTTTRPAAVVPAHRAPAWSRPAVAPQAPTAVSQSVVALGGIEAFYGPRGHAVRVYWSAASQASASVQLIDERGAVVSATTVRGGRQNALLYLPRRFRGALTVQVSSQGRLGERVAETTSLPPFGY